MGKAASKSKGKQVVTQEKKNYIGKDGKVMRCHRCNSEYHFIADCPNKTYPKDESTNAVGDDIIELMVAEEIFISEGNACLYFLSGDSVHQYISIYAFINITKFDLIRLILCMHILLIEGNPLIVK